MIVSRECFERGCACYDDRVDKDGVMISEVDINDMKALYDLDRGTYFKLAPTPVVQVPPDSNEFKLSGVYKFHNLDGMYSYCTAEDGTVHHFAAWTNVIPWFK